MNFWGKLKYRKIKSALNMFHDLILLDRSTRYRLKCELRLFVSVLLFRI